VDGSDPARVGQLDRRAHRLHVLVVGGLDVRVPEVPAGLLAQDAGRIALLVQLDDAAGHLQVAVRACERRRVQPDRVRVAGHQCDRRLSRELVQRLFRRLDLRLPVAAAPAAAEQPGSRADVRERCADAGKRLVE
jgi:hypothetical protein